QLERLNLRLLNFPKNIQLLAFDLGGEVDTRRLELRQIQTPQIAHLHVESRVQIGERSVRVQFHVQQAGRRRFQSDILEKFFDVEIFGLKHGRNSSIRWKNGCVSAE